MFCPFSKSSNRFVFSIAAKTEGYVGDFSCYGNITVGSVALKEHRSCTRGLGGFPFDLKCFVMGRLKKCFGPVCVSVRCISC